MRLYAPPSSGSETARRRASQRQNLVLAYEPGLLGSNGLPVGLSELSALQKLLIARVRLFNHVLKVVVDSRAVATMSGHVIAMRTDAAQQAAMVNREMPAVPSDSPNEPPILSVCFIGPMDRLQTILHANVEELMPRPIRLLRNRYLNSTYEPIRMWLPSKIRNRGRM